MAFWVVGRGSSLGNDAPSIVTAPGQLSAYMEGREGKRETLAGEASEVTYLRSGFGPSGKRRVVYATDDSSDSNSSTTSTRCTPSCRGIIKRPRLDHWGQIVGYHGSSGCSYDYALTSSNPVNAAAAARGTHTDPLDGKGSIPVKNLAFLVIRERESSPALNPTRPPPPISPEPWNGGRPLAAPHSPSHALPVGVTTHGPVSPMERTQSGLSISSDTAAVQCPRDEEVDALLLLSDQAAANLVRRHVAKIRHRHRDSQHGRILMSLINPKNRAADFALDNDALRSIFSAANELFFANRLSQRVEWDWSHPASAQYESHIVGTTALRRSARLGGFETLIVLSSPILKDTKYNRRLLISTFLHEMIHSFLFVMCGFKARQCGGHTDGFRQIAEIIDEWVGKDILRLRDMEADLERFIDDGNTDDLSVRHPMSHLNGHSHSHSHSHSYGPSLNHYNSNSHDLNCQIDRSLGQKNERLWRVQGPRHHSANQHPMIQAPQPYRSHSGEWEWHDREGFRAPALHPDSTSHLW